MSEIAQSSFFKLVLGGNGGLVLTGSFERVSGLGMQFEYESYMEGGSSVPVQFVKAAVSQRLVLECGTDVSYDALSTWMNLISLGTTVKLAGTISLCDQRGDVKRMWVITNAYPVRYVGPELDSNKTSAAVSTLELIYGGCS